MVNTIPPLRVGVVGANSKQSWSKDSHIPAIKALPDLQLTAVATRSEESARAAAQAFEVAAWYDNSLELVHSNEVDIVSVCVKVPEHCKIVLEAIASRKHVVCDWVLGRNIEEAEELATAAKQAGVHAVIMLQGRASPAARRARQLVVDGAIGRLLSGRIIATTSGFGPETLSSYAYFEDPNSGANLTSIQGGHVLDLASYVLGEIDQVSAITAIQSKSVHLIDTDQWIERSVPDLLLMHTRHHNGCITSINVEGNRLPDTKFTFEIIGTEGQLTLKGGHLYGFQAGELKLECDCAVNPPDAPIVTGLLPTAVNVAEFYAQLSRDIRSVTWTLTDFDHAVRLTRLIEVVKRADSTRKRQRVHDF